jgi:hypothetical protein
MLLLRHLDNTVRWPLANGVLALLRGGTAVGGPVVREYLLLRSRNILDCDETDAGHPRLFADNQDSQRLKVVQEASNDRGQRAFPALGPGGQGSSAAAVTRTSGEVHPPPGLSRRRRANCGLLRFFTLEDEVVYAILGLAEGEPGRPAARYSNARSPHFLILLNSLPGPVGRLVRRLLAPAIVTLESRPRRASRGG